MTGPLERRARLLASLYRTFGETAHWAPQGGGPGRDVVVRRGGGEDVVSFGGSEAIVEVGTLRVRLDDGRDFRKGDRLTIERTAEVFAIGSRPRRTKTGTEWVIEPIAQAE